MAGDALLRQLLACVEAGTPCATATIVASKGSVPNEVGAKMLVGAGGALLGGTVGGGAIEHRVLALAGQALAEGRSRLVEARLTEAEAGGIGMMCGGQVQVFVEVHRPPPRLVLLGAGHINVQLARLGEPLGFRVTVVDDREDWASAELYPKAERVVARPEEALAGLGLDRESYVVIGTRDRDAEALVAAARTAACYIGLVASKRKAIRIVKEVADRVDLDALVPRLRSPVGLDLGGRSPEAIALSVMAEIQAHRHGRDGRPMTVDPERLWELLPATARR